MKNIIKITTLSLFAAALVALPVLANAGDAVTNAPASDMTNNAPTIVKKKHGALPFHGAIVSLDASAGTFTVGELNLSVTSTTKITTNTVPATLADFKIGDKVSGAYKKTADGTLQVTTLHYAPKKKAPTPATTQ